jgi:hypothetical protein
MTCLVWLLVLIAGIVLVMSLIRWFEQTLEAARHGWWNKLLLLVVCPPAVWFYPSSVSAGRPTAVPLHEPVRGFGLSKERKTAGAGQPAGEAPQRVVPVADEDGPPPGTPAEFLVKPVVPEKPARRREALVDPEKIAKLRQKMREQGMLGEDE